MEWRRVLMRKGQPVERERREKESDGEREEVREAVSPF